MPSQPPTYCARCKHRPTCTIPCYPVEQLLESITKKQTEHPTDLTDYIDVPNPNVFVPPLSWTSKSTTRKVFELCVEDKYTQCDAASIVGCSQQHISKVLKRIYDLVDGL